MKGEIDCDTWGLRKFVSHFNKRLTQTTRPKDIQLQLTDACMHTWIDLYVSYAWHALYSYCKDPSVRELKRIFLEAYFPDRVGELDDPANDEEVCLAYISRACSTCAHAVG